MTQGNNTILVLAACEARVRRLEEALQMIEREVVRYLPAWELRDPLAVIELRRIQAVVQESQKGVLK